MRVAGKYSPGLFSQRCSHSGFTLLPTRVSSGPTFPPTRLPASFCTAWHDEQKDAPYKVAAVVMSGDPPPAGALNGTCEAVEGLLCAMRKAEMSAASWSLS